MIKVKIDVTKLDKTAFFKGAKGTYVDLVLWECKGGRDQYGNDFSVKQDMGKDRKGEKTPFIGSAKYAGKSAAPAAEQEPEVYNDMKDAPKPMNKSAGSYAPSPSQVPPPRPAAVPTNPADDSDVPY